MLFRRLFCKHHNQKCITNIYGDLINDYDCRSIWKCLNCGQLIKSDELCKDCKTINFTMKTIFDEKKD